MTATGFGGQTGDQQSQDLRFTFSCHDFFILSLDVARIKTLGSEWWRAACFKEGRSLAEIRE